ncbi:MAG: AhpC/TSA family protein [Bacteroidales bacterium]|jgi:peroxiredoxin|nr:AhpC/TSA family protein [Bacteroidales bacterium]
MKKCFILGVVVILASCGREKSIRIKGEFSGAGGDMIYLQKLGTDKLSTTSDSVKLDAKGHFSVKYRIDHPTFYSLAANGKSITLLLYPKDQITITGDVRRLPLTYQVQGNDASEEIRQLSRYMEHTISVRDSLNGMLQQFIDNRNFVNIQRQFEWNFLREVDSLRAYNIRFINTHPGSPAVIYALYQQIEPNVYLFNREGDLKYFQKADSVFHKKYPKMPHVKMLHANTLQWTETDRLNKLNKMLYMLGRDAPEIALPSPSGKIEKLSAHKGKYVLLDFWASWSAPSRTENTNLVEIYEKYSNRGFDIFQVSLDKTKSAWEKAIREDKLLAWTHVCDLKFWDSEAVKEYGIETVPANFLIDNEGTIIAKGLSGDALDKKLSEIFAQAE